MGDFQIKNEIIRLDFRGLENEVENANWYRSLCQLNNNQHRLVCESWGSMGKEEECRWCGYDNYQKHDPPLLFDPSIDMTERLDIAIASTLRPLREFSGLSNVTSNLSLMRRNDFYRLGQQWRKWIEHQCGQSVR